MGAVPPPRGYSKRRAKLYILNPSIKIPVVDSRLL
jgi:hypothetical protein